MVISLTKSKFTQSISKRINIYKIGAFQFCYFGDQNSRTLVYQNFISGNLWVCTLPVVISSRSSDVTHWGLLLKLRKSDFILESKMPELNQNKKSK